MKKIVTIAAKTLLFFLYIAMWLYVGIILLLASGIGMFSCFNDLYGDWSMWVLTGITVIVFLFPVYSYRFIKNKYLLILYSFVLSIALFICIYGAHHNASGKFSEFTYEKWTEYPRQRYLMTNNLINEHGIIGMHSEDAIKLLGEPDEKTENCLTYYYEYGFIDFLMKDNIISSVEDVNYW